MAEIKDKSLGKNKITFNIDKENQFSEWFSEIINKAELADLRYNVKGFVVFRPWAVMAMEKMYDLFEDELKRKNHLPAWFPSVVPEENFNLEKEHVKGFVPYVFWITHASDTKLEQKLALRPTSETIIFPLYSLWIRSYKDLPLKIYQRAQVWRYETKATRPFIRSREFYWIEAHNCFAIREDAETQVQEDIDTTEKIMHQKLGIPFLALKRPEWDKFPGAIYTIGSDCLLPDGKLIQQPSTHLLGQGFAKTFNIKFIDEKGKENYVWQTCYGPAISRIFASIISVHGDKNGLILPFIIAPTQAIIIPIYAEKNKNIILKKCREIETNLQKNGIYAKTDDKEIGVGEKYYFWEMKGVPMRIEIGEKEIKNKKVCLFIRDSKERKIIDEKKIIEAVSKEGNALDERLRKKADLWFEKHIVNCKNKDEIKKAFENKNIARCNFCSIEKDGEKCAEIVEKEFLADVRGVRADKKEKTDGQCVFCGKKAKEIVYIGKSY